LKIATFAPTQQSSELATKYGYDEWIVSRFLRFVPNTEKMLARMQQQPQKYIRTNTLKITDRDLRARLESKGFELRETLVTNVFEVENKNADFSIGATSEYMLGYYYIQDITSCIAVEALDVMQDQIVLDMASAPGGKTTLIAQKMKNTGSIIAVEPNPQRIKSLLFNITRSGIINTCIYETVPSKLLELNIKFDRVLLDAPCSGEGVIAKDPTRRTSRFPSDIAICSIMQRKLIEIALTLLKPGGLIVYSTCSFAPEENEDVVNSALDRFNIHVESLDYGEQGLTKFGGLRFDERLRYTKRFYPHIHNSLGFYIAKLRRNNR
jgi:NOL1/NOP2/sun family putative RNA methylase